VNCYAIASEQCSLCLLINNAEVSKRKLRHLQNLLNCSSSLHSFTNSKSCSLLLLPRQIWLLRPRWPRRHNHNYYRSSFVINKILDPLIIIIIIKIHNNGRANNKFFLPTLHHRGTKLLPPLLHSWKSFLVVPLVVSYHLIIPNLHAFIEETSEGCR